MHDYPSSTFEKFDETESGLLSECPCVALTASDGRGFQNSCGEGYTSLGTIWGLRDVIFECQNCQHDTQNGLLQNRVVQNGALTCPSIGNFSLSIRGTRSVHHGA
eukprot:COSAG02_NODE_35917_length_461_cov_1.132597_1_plen_105_part_00